MQTNIAHKKRVRSELAKAGVTGYGLITLQARYAHKILHKDEAVYAVAYGRYSGGSGMLIATDRRVIFLDRKPLYTISDTINYYSITGIGINSQGYFSSVTVHTRTGDYFLRYVNRHAAHKFVKYIEERRISSTEDHSNKPHPKIEVAKTATAKEAIISQTVADFLTSKDTGVISTINRAGHARGSVVHYVLVGNCIYFLTRSDAKKSHNILAHHQTSFTVYDRDTLQTVQINCQAIIESNPNKKAEIFELINRPRLYGTKVLQTPLSSGSTKEGFVVFKLTPTKIDFKSHLV